MQPSTDSKQLPPWQINLFGGLRILYRDQPVSAPPFRSQALLALLVLHPSKHKREQLAGELFPDSPEDTAKARVSDRLWLLKIHLPDFPLNSTPTEINIEERQVWVDVNEFRLLICNGDPASLFQAIELYRGDLLPEQDADWLLLERENLYLTYVRALQSLSAHFLQNGDPRQAIPLLEKLHTTEPFDENNLRGLLRAHQSVGGRGAALAAFDRFRVHLRDEMGLAPEPATLEIVEAIRTQTMPPPPPRADLKLPAAPRDLFQRGQVSLWHGDFPTLQACVELLRKKSASSKPTRSNLPPSSCAATSIQQKRFSASTYLRPC